MNDASYKKAVKWFLDRVPMTDDERQLLMARSSDTAWLVANNIQLKLCQSVLDKIEDAELEQKPFDDFKKELIEWFP